MTHSYLKACKNNSLPICTKNNSLSMCSNVDWYVTCYGIGIHPLIHGCSQIYRHADAPSGSSVIYRYTCINKR